MKLVDDGLVTEIRFVPRTTLADNDSGLGPDLVAITRPVGS